MVGLARTYSGLVSLHIPCDLAIRATSSMIGMEVRELDDGVNDALGDHQHDRRIIQAASIKKRPGYAIDVDIPGCRISSAGRQVEDSVKTTFCRSGRAAWCFDAFVPSFAPTCDLEENDGK